VASEGLHFDEDTMTVMDFESGEIWYTLDFDENEGLLSWTR
jgi:hypothetical protein